jgi:hypothetical protein
MVEVPSGHKSGDTHTWSVFGGKQLPSGTDHVVHNGVVVAFVAVCGSNSKRIRGDPVATPLPAHFAHWRTARGASSLHQRERK